MSTTDSDMFYVRGLPGKSKVIAARNITTGTRILTEEPFITVSTSPQNDDSKLVDQILADRLKTLSPEQTRSIFGFNNSYEVAWVRLGDEDKAGFFPRIQRFRHACRPNAETTWNANIKRETIHALRDIERGEEITRSMIGALPQYEDRQKILGFKCGCELCRREDRYDVDTYLREIRDFTRLIESGKANAVSSIPLESKLDLVRRIMSHLPEYGIEVVSTAQAYSLAHGVASFHGDRERARIFKEREYACSKIAYGDDHPSCLRMADELNKMTAEGTKKSLDSTDMAEFEAWLWMVKEHAKRHTRGEGVIPPYRD